jgi:TonB family protein
MSRQLRTASRLTLLTGAGFMLALTLACSNPFNRFTNQYKCQVPGKQDPRTAYEYVERGMEHVRADQISCALSACSEALRLDSKLSTGYACRGAVLVHQGEFQKARTDFDSALKLQPDNGDFYYSRAQVQDKLGETDKALADSTKATELITSTFGRSVAFAFRGSLHQKQAKLEEAIKDYSEAILLAPDFAYHYGNRGKVYAELKEFNKAIADYGEAIRLDPKNEYFLRDRAKAYRELRQFDQATEDDSAADVNANARAASPQPAPSPSDESSVMVKEPIAGGDLKGKAIWLVYPPVDRVGRASGIVVVQVSVDEAGKVISARVQAGHPLLQAACVDAARNSKFRPTQGGVNGTITYEFKNSH